MKPWYIIAAILLGFGCAVAETIDEQTIEPASSTAQRYVRNEQDCAPLGPERFFFNPRTGERIP